MAQINPEFVERYQIEYERNPRSRIFAPLAEAYRKMGMLQEAQRICMRGVEIHPDFAGGRVAYARVLDDLKKPDKALEQLQKAVASSPDNIMAHSLMAETLLALRRPKEALKSFKMVLFLNPGDEKAKQAVAKWQFLEAEEYDDELFDVDPRFGPERERAHVSNKAAHPSQPEAIERAVERAVSLADAFTMRGDPEKALEVLTAARRHTGSSPEIDKRMRLLARRTQALVAEPAPAPAPVSTANVPRSSDLRRQKLEMFLRRINERRSG